MKRNKQHRDDVQIGGDEWIRFVDITGRTENATNIDDQLHSMEPFWRSLEVRCVSECCGISAHSFLPRDIWNAARNCRDAGLKDRLTALRHHLDRLSSDCVFSTTLNQYLDREMFAKLLDHVIATLNRM